MSSQDMSFVENKKRTAYNDRIELAISDVQREREFFQQPLPFDNEYLRTHREKSEDSYRATLAYSRADFAAFQRARDAAEKARDSTRNYPDFSNYHDLSKIEDRRLFCEAVFAAKMVIADHVVAINAELDVLRRSAATAEVHSVFATARAEDQPVEWSTRLAKEAVAKAKSAAKEVDDYVKAYVDRVDAVFTMASQLSRETNKVIDLEARYAIVLAAKAKSKTKEAVAKAKSEAKEVVEMVWLHILDLFPLAQGVSQCFFSFYHSRGDSPIKKPMRRFEQ